MCTSERDKENKLMISTELKAAVNKLLLNEYDFEPEEAEETIEQSSSEKPLIWNENAVPADLAKFLASGEAGD